MGRRQRGAFLTGNSAIDREPLLDDRVPRADNEIESANLKARATSPNPLGEADSGEVMPRKRKATRKTKTPKLKGVARKAGKRTDGNARVASKPEAVPCGFTLRAPATLYEMGLGR